MKFREFNLPGYNQHRCFSELGWDKHDGRGQGHELTRKPVHCGSMGILQHLPVLACSKGETWAGGAFLHTEEHSQKCVPKAAPSQRTARWIPPREKEGSGPGNSWRVQWLELHAFTSKGEGSFLSWGGKKRPGQFLCPGDRQPSARESLL